MPSTESPKCPCGCGASIKGWSRAGSSNRINVPRVYRIEHGACHYCGGPTDQYHQCPECV